jgi:hypothetical protein
MRPFNSFHTLTHTEEEKEEKIHFLCVVVVKLIVTFKFEIT